jgi:hypothetical protein
MFIENKSSNVCYIERKIKVYEHLAVTQKLSPQQDNFRDYNLKDIDSSKNKFYNKLCEIIERENKGWSNNLNIGGNNISCKIYVWIILLKIAFE